MEWDRKTSRATGKVTYYQTKFIQLIPSAKLKERQVRVRFYQFFVGSLSVKNVILSHISVHLSFYSDKTEGPDLDIFKEWKEFASFLFA